MALSLIHCNSNELGETFGGHLHNEVCLSRGGLKGVASLKSQNIPQKLLLKKLINKQTRQVSLLVQRSEDYSEHSKINSKISQV